MYTQYYVIQTIGQTCIYSPQGGSGRTERVGHPQKCFNPSLSVLNYKAGLSGPSPSIVPLPNQTKSQCNSLSVTTIMSMSVSNVDGSGFSN